MPCLSIKHERKVEEVMNISLKNEKALGYEISSIYEVIKFELNEAGVKVENEGAIFVEESASQRPSLRLNSAFWVVMRELGSHPYLIAFVNELARESQNATQLEVINAQGEPISDAPF